MSKLVFQILKYFPIGLGLHLQSLASKLPNQWDMHEPWRKLASLSPYEHLHRIFHFCTVHGYRNIQETNVSEQVKNLMRSLMCIEHCEWDATILKIEDLGAKPGSGATSLQDVSFSYY
jgi:hypothetical protein